MRLLALVAAALLAGCLSAEPPSGARSPSLATPVAASGEVEAPSGRYLLDPAHASVLWRVSHLGLSMYTGRFERVAGTLEFDARAPERSTLQVVIDAASVSTGYAALGRDRDFDAEIAEALGAAEAPEIGFVATGIARTGPATGQVRGELTLNGQTHPLTLAVTFYGAKLDPLARKTRMGFAARGVLDRAAWGVDRWSGFGVGREVELIIEAEFLKA